MKSKVKVKVKVTLEEAKKTHKELLWNFILEFFFRKFVEKIQVCIKIWQEHPVLSLKTCVHVWCSADFFKFLDLEMFQTKS
jgi:hypothetical protein